MLEPALENLRVGNPATRALPLLQRVARQESGRAVLPATIGNQLVVDVVSA
jgi:hypothetical protein